MQDEISLFLVYKDSGFNDKNMIFLIENPKPAVQVRKIYQTWKNVGREALSVLKRISVGPYCVMILFLISHRNIFCLVAPNVPPIYNLKMCVPFSGFAFMFVYPRMINTFPVCSYSAFYNTNKKNETTNQTLFVM